MLRDVLAGFQGVLVSDFYGAYEYAVRSAEMPIHLMRDINEAITKAPFNKEVSGISIAFGKLLRAIVETVDRRGLKCRYLRKHERDVEKVFPRSANGDPH